MVATSGISLVLDVFFAIEVHGSSESGGVDSLHFVGQVVMTSNLGSTSAARLCPELQKHTIQTISEAPWQLGSESESRWLGPGLRRRKGDTGGQSCGKALCWSFEG